jgi:hypothetical protein
MARQARAKSSYRQPLRSSDTKITTPTPFPGKDEVVFSGACLVVCKSLDGNRRLIQWIFVRMIYAQSGPCPSVVTSAFDQ